MKAYNSRYFETVSKWQGLLLFLLFTAVLFSNGAHAAGEGDPVRYHGSGQLTSLESNDIILIDEKGYAVDPSVLVVNTAGNPISLDKLSIPTAINFEYIYLESAPKTMSPVIVFIEEAKKSRIHGRSMQ